MISNTQGLLIGGTVLGLAVVGGIAILGRPEKREPFAGVDIKRESEGFVKLFDGRPQGNGDGAIHGASEGKLRLDSTSERTEMTGGADTETSDDDKYRTYTVKGSYNWDISRLVKKAQPHGAPATAEDLARVMSRYDKGDGNEFPAGDGKLGGAERQKFKREVGVVDSVKYVEVEPYP